MESHMDLRISYFPGKFIQGNHAVKELDQFIQLFGGRPYLLVTPSMKRVVEEYGYDRYDHEFMRRPCCWKVIDELVERIRDQDYTVIVGIGGGKIVDIAKAAADKLDLKVILVPTVAASSAAFSACSVIYTEDNIEESVYYEKHSPDVLLLDNSLIMGAGTRHLVAGMGDALAVYFEAKGCVRSGAENSLHAQQTFCALAMCDYCLDALLQYGLEAKTACDKKTITPAVERIIELNLLSAGIAFEGGGLAAAHAIHNGLTILPKVRQYLHGEVVAFGVLSELHLTHADPEETDRIYTFCEKIGLPTTLGQIGAGDMTPEVLKEVAQAVYHDPYLHHEGSDITVEDIYDAMSAADAMGRDRKAVAK